MPKSKGTGSPSSKLNTMDKVKDSAADSGEHVGVFTRSQARRLSVSVPAHISPPKKSRRSSISRKAAQTAVILNESRNQNAKDKSASLSIGEIVEEIVDESNDGEVSKSLPCPKKRKSKKGDGSESAAQQTEIEEQESGCTKTLKSPGKFCEEVVQDNIISGVKRTKGEKSRKSKIMENIIEDKIVEDMGNVTSYVEPSKINGIGSTDKCQTIVNSADSFIEEKSIQSLEKSRRKLTPKSTPSKLDIPLAELDATPQTVSKRSITPAKLSSKKTDGGTPVEKTPKMLASPSASVEKIDHTPLQVSKAASAVKLSSKKIAMSDELTPKNLEFPANENIGKSPLSVSKKAVSSAKKTDVETAIEKTPKPVGLPSIDNLDKTPLSVSKKAVSSAKLSAKRTDLETAVEKTPEATGLPSISSLVDSPLQVSKKAKLSAKRTDLQTAVEKTPEATGFPSISSLVDSPLQVSKKAKLSAKRTDLETAVEKTPEATGLPSISSLVDSPLQVSKKAKLLAKKASMEDESTLNKVELPLIEKITKIPQLIAKKTESLVKLSAQKSISKDETTPKKIESSTVEMLAKTPMPVLKKPASPVKLSAKKAVIEDDTDSDEDSDAESRKEIMRSAEKRIIRNLSTSESESRNHVKVLQLPVVDVQADQQMETSSDSDSAPEDVTFDASRQSALELLKQTVDSIKRDKQKKKEKRKERLEVWRQRKEENLIRLKETKANRDDASCSSSEESLHERNGQLKVAVPSQGKKTYIEDEQSKPSLKRLPADIVNSLPDHLPKVPKMALKMAPKMAPQMAPKELGEKVVTEKGKKRKVGKNDKKVKAKKYSKMFTNDVDFKELPGGRKTMFGVVALDVPTLKTVSEKAANFKQNLLYGKQIRRVPASTLMKNRKKLQVNMK